jgi:glycolate oxidase
VTAAADAVCRIMASGHVPSLLELMDHTTISAVNKLTRMGLPESTRALLLVGFDTPDAAGDLAAVGALCAAAGAATVVPAEDAAESEMLLQARRMANAALDALGTTMIDDVAVPRSKLGEMLDGVSAIGERHALTIAVCAHAGDGNTHPTVCFDADDADQVRRAREAFDEIMALGLRLGGTITGEHGIGMLKKDWLARELGPTALELQRGLRALFDPLGILNPGKVL